MKIRINFVSEYLNEYVLDYGLNIYYTMKRITYWVSKNITDCMKQECDKSNC